MYAELAAIATSGQVILVFGGFGGFLFGWDFFFVLGGFVCLFWLRFFLVLFLCLFCGNVKPNESLFKN